MNKKWNVIAVDGRCENDSPQQVLISTKKNQFHNENVYKFLSVSSALNVKMGEKNMRKMLLSCPVWETNEKKKYRAEGNNGNYNNPARDYTEGWLIFNHRI